MAAAAQKQNVIGAGAFGAVIQPALQNTLNGELKDFPDNVTKVFFVKRNMNTALNTAKKLPRLMGNNNGHRIYPYSRKIKGSNLPANLFTKLKARKELNMNSNLHILRMPYLGVDIYHLNAIHAEELRKVPITTILEQIQKLIHQTGKLAEAGYGHFDIRQTNVMVRPETGTLTIIDFDWLMPLKDLEKEYKPHFGYFSNPPESLLAKLVGRPYLSIYDVSVVGYTRENWTYNEKILRPMGITSMLDLKRKYEEAIADTYSMLDPLESKFKDCLPYFDNYGLAFTLLLFIEAVYGAEVIRKTDATTSFDEVVKLLLRMCAFKLRERISPAEAVAAIDAIMARVGEEPEPAPEPAPAPAPAIENNMPALVATANNPNPWTPNYSKTRRRHRRGRRNQTRKK